MGSQEADFTSGRFRFSIPKRVTLRPRTRVQRMQAPLGLVSEGRRSEAPGGSEGERQGPGSHAVGAGRRRVYELCQELAPGEARREVGGLHQAEFTCRCWVSCCNQVPRTGRCCDCGEATRPGRRPQGRLTLEVPRRVPPASPQLPVVASWAS